MGMRFDKLNILEDDIDEYFEPMLLSDDDKNRRKELANLLIDVFLYFFSVYEVHLMHNSMLKQALYEQLLNDRIADAVSQVTGIDGEMSNHIRTLSKQVVNTTFKYATKEKLEAQAQAKAQAQVGQKNDTTPYTRKKTLIPNSESAFLYDPDESLDEPLTSGDSPLSIFDELGEDQDISEDEDEVEDVIKDETNENFWLSIKRAAEISFIESNTFLNYSDFVAAKKRGCKYKTWYTVGDPKVRETHAAIDGMTIEIDKDFIVGQAQLLFPHDWTGKSAPQETCECRCTVIYE